VCHPNKQSHGGKGAASETEREAGLCLGRGKTNETRAEPYAAGGVGAKLGGGQWGTNEKKRKMETKKKKNITQSKGKKALAGLTRQSRIDEGRKPWKGEKKRQTTGK